MKILKKCVVFLVICLMVLSCCEDDKDTKVVYLDNPVPSVIPPEPSMLNIFNGVGQSNMDVLVGVQNLLLDRATFLNPSGEKIVISSIVIEDDFLGVALNPEIENVELWVDLNGEASPYGNPAETLISPRVLSMSPGVLVIPFYYPIVMRPGNFLDFYVMADIALGGDTITPSRHTFNVISADAYGITTGQNCDLDIDTNGVTFTLVAKGKVILTANSNTPPSMILINGEGTNGYQDILLFNLEVGDAENIGLVSLNFNLEGKSGNSFYKIASSSGFSGGFMFPANITGPFGINFGPPPTVAAGSTQVMTLQYKGGVGIPYAVNGDGFRINSVSLNAFGKTSTKSITYSTDTVTMPWMYLYTTRPMFALAADSPSGNISPSTNTVIAAYNVAALSGGDIKFNTLNVQINSNCSIHSGSKWVFLTDETGPIVAVATNLVDICSSPLVTLTFAANDWIVPAGTSKKLYVHADTTDLVSQNVIQAVLTDTDPNNIDWSIPNQFNLSDNHHHADIIFRGNIYGHTLVVP